MEYQATAKYLRVSPRKARLVADSIRNLTPEQALTALSQFSKSAGSPLSAVIRSAIANAKQKQAIVDDLKFKQIEVMEGSKMKRFRAVSRGIAHQYKKRTTHVRIVLTDGNKEPKGK